LLNSLDLFLTRSWNSYPYMRHPLRLIHGTTRLHSKTPTMGIAKPSPYLHKTPTMGIARSQTPLQHQRAGIEPLSPNTTEESEDQTPE
jgi:hypothetical protein